MKELAERLLEELGAWETREQVQLPVQIKALMVELYERLHVDRQRELRRGMHQRRLHRIA